MKVKSPSKHISLNLLLEIQNNSYRSRCGKFEFEASEIEDLIMQKQSKNDQKKVENDLKNLELYQKYLDEIEAS